MRMSTMRFMDFGTLKKETDQKVPKQKEMRLSRRLRKKASFAEDPTTALTNKEWCLYVM